MNHDAAPASSLAQSPRESEAAGPERRPWPYAAGLPERFGQNYHRYISRGGIVRPEEDVRGFVAPQPGNGNDMARFYFFCLALDQLEKEGITGDLAELGVYKGATATLIARIARHLGTTAYLLDTYEGFSTKDFTGPDAHQQVLFTDTSLEAVRTLVGEENVQYIKGHFPGSAPQLPNDNQYCLVHLDCDLYAPLIASLEYFYPRLAPGGYLIVHDYSSLHWDGAERAVDEFFADKPESPIALTDSAGSAVIRKLKRSDRSDNWFVRRRAAFIGKGWLSAANHGLGPLLGEGWSGPEDWGMWGVGASHQLLLYQITEFEHDLLLEADVHAVLIGPRLSLEIEVWAQGRLLTVWHFWQGENRGVRSVRIPASAGTPSPGALPFVTVEFRPRDVRPPTLLDPTTVDARPLGLAVWKIRLTPSIDGQGA